MLSALEVFAPPGTSQPPPPPTPPLRVDKGKGKAPPPPMDVDNVGVSGSRHAPRPPLVVKPTTPKIGPTINFQNLRADAEKKLSDMLLPRPKKSDKHPPSKPLSHPGTVPPRLVNPTFTSKVAKGKPAKPLLVETVVQVAQAFPNLPANCVQAMAQQVEPSKASGRRKAPNTTPGRSRKQVITVLSGLPEGRLLHVEMFLETIDRGLIIEKRKIRCLSTLHNGAG